MEEDEISTSSLPHAAGINHHSGRNIPFRHKRTVRHVNESLRLSYTYLTGSMLRMASADVSSGPMPMPPPATTVPVLVAFTSPPATDPGVCWLLALRGVWPGGSSRPEALAKPMVSR